MEEITEQLRKGLKLSAFKVVFYNKKTRRTYRFSCDPVTGTGTWYSFVEREDNNWRMNVYNLYDKYRAKLFKALIRRKIKFIKDNAAILKKVA